MTLPDAKQLKVIFHAIAGAADYVFQAALVAFCLTAEVSILKHGLPQGVDPVMVGRVLGLLDGLTMMVMAFRYQSNRASQRKDEVIAKSLPVVEEDQKP